MNVLDIHLIFSYLTHLKVDGIPPEYTEISVIASVPQNIGCVQYTRRTSLPVHLEYCTKPIFCGIDAIADLLYG